MLVRETSDYMPEDLPLTSNENWPRAAEYLVKDEVDLRKLAYLLTPPDNAALAELREYGERAKAFAGERGILLEADARSLSILALGVVGATPLLVAALEDRSLVEQVLDLALQWSTAWNHSST